MDTTTKPEMQQSLRAGASAIPEALPTYTQYAQYGPPSQEPKPIWRRPSFIRRSLFFVVCLLILSVLFTGLVCAVDFYKNAILAPGSTDPNMVPAQPTMGAVVVGARGADVVARQWEDRSLGMFACPHVPGLSCGWGQACSPGGCIDLHPNRRAERIAVQSSEQAPYASSSAVPTEYPTPTTWATPITLPTTWGITYPTAAPSASSTEGAAGTETTPDSYSTSSSSGGNSGQLPTVTSTSSEPPATSPTESPENPEQPNAATRSGGDAFVVSGAAWSVAMVIMAGLFL